MVALIGLALALMPLGTPGATPPLFNVETVDSLGRVGYDHDMYLDGTGTPHISFSSRQSHNPNERAKLKYATRVDGRWEVELVDPTSPWGDQSSIVVDPEGVPHIAYTHFNGSSYVVRHAWRESGSWLLETVAPGGGPTIALDSLGGIHVAYMSPTQPNILLRYAFRRTGAWSIRTIDPRGPEDAWGEFYMGNPSIAVTADGVPHILYIEQKSRYVGSGEEWITELTHLTRGGGGWVYAIVDSGTGGGRNITVRLDRRGDPHASYIHDYQPSVRYAHATNGVWSVETVEPNWGFANAFTLDSAGRPHITYAATSLYEVRYARRSGNGWAVSAVATGAAGSTRIAVGSDGAVNITFHDFNHQENMMYARSRILATPIREEEPDPAVTRVSVSPGLAPDFRMYPNPAAGTAQIFFSAPGFPLSVGIYEVSGRRVRTLRSALASQGPIAWDRLDDHGREVAPGVYLVRASVRGQTITRRLVLVR